MSGSLNILCVSSYFKGVDFITAISQRGHQVYLLTGAKLKEEPWPWDHIEDSFFMDLQADGSWNMQHLLDGLGYRMRSIKFHKIIALDDFDVEQVAHIREHFRIPGMGSTTARYFRDKLAMRMKAMEAGIPVPRFSSLFNDQEINEFCQNQDQPWLIKPRSEASATGIQKIHSTDELWNAVNGLGDKRPSYLVEKFTPGDVYHVDSLVLDGKVIFSQVSKYLDTPFEVAHGGGIFRSRTLQADHEDAYQLRSLNEQVMKAFGMKNSASHSEFIKSHEHGEYFFLETSARVGGANIAEMVEAASGINLWKEWAHIELAVFFGEEYRLPDTRSDNAGIVVSLSRFESPDTTSFSDPEVCWRMNKKWHIGMIVKSEDPQRVGLLLDDYSERIANEFHARLDPPDAARV